MPTTSSYYADLEYPTVNEDASTYGAIINTYLDGLLTKLKTISDRVTNAQAQLGNINRGVNAVDRINTTLSGAIDSSALLPGTSTTLLPDPYSGTYTKTTTWPAYTSELSSFSLPTTQSEVANFDYQGFANALTTEVNRIEATVTQAEADILTAQKDTCRAKKYIDAYNNQTTETVLEISETQILSIGGALGRVHSSTQLLLWPVETLQTDLAGVYPLYGYGTSPARTSPSSIKMEVDISSSGWPSVSNGGTVSNNFGMNSTAGTLTIFSGPVYYSSGNEFFYQMLITLPTGYEFDTSGLSDLYPPGTTTSGQPYYPTNIPVNGIGYPRVTVKAVSSEYVTRTVTPTLNLSECENPTPPYFS